ncbi:hypothetical protein [Photobacterium leiognathi]|uniref:hypothetical protein n=1 Tax=Photobacterium leiognathi TaxID=553611 RepID=UPI00273407A8|nr:hypothetical protein [Photobacterium leiognathi]
MNDLITYILAFNTNDSFIIDRKIQQHTYLEDDVEIHHTEERATFSNGAVMLKTTEFDETLDILNDSICPECWINYEIITQPQGEVISPKKKIFTSRCQESFWLKLQKTRTEIN